MRPHLQIQVMSWNRTYKQDLAGDASRVRAAALRYLGRREYSAAELRVRLEKRGAAPEDIDAVLEYVFERGYQDDARAGESHIRQRLQYTPRGRALVRQELKERGLSNELSAALLDEYYPPEAERDILRRLLAKEAAPKISLSGPDDAQNARRQRHKMARRLLAKGFCQAAVIDAMAEWLPPPDDDLMD